MIQRGGTKRVCILGALPPHIPRRTVRECVRLARSMSKSASSSGLFHGHNRICHPASLSWSSGALLIRPSVRRRKWACKRSTPGCSLPSFASHYFSSYTHTFHFCLSLLTSHLLFSFPGFINTFLIWRVVEQGSVSLQMSWPLLTICQGFAIHATFSD